MPSSYTTNLGLEKPATGEQAGVWGITANTSYDSIDTATDGNLSISLSASTYTLVTAQGAASEGRNKLITWTGTLGQQATVNLQPNTAKKLYFMQNRTIGGYSILFQQGTGGGFTLQAGYGAIIYADGAGAGAKVAQALENPQFTNILATQLTVGTLIYTQPQTFTQPVTFTQPATFASLTVTGAATIGGPATINNLTANNLAVTAAGHAAGPYDLYYRDPASGLVTPLPIGASGQTLQVVGGAPAWATPASIAVGAPIGGSLANAIYFANATPVLAQDSHILAKTGVGIGLGVLPTHTLHLGYTLQPEIWLDTNDPVHQIRQLVWATNGQQRWVATATETAEPGGNAGSDWTLLAYNDAVTAAHVLLFGTRATGNLSLGFGADGGARMGVFNDIPAQPAMLVRGASGQTAVLQTWQNSASTSVASIDNSGSLTLAGGLSIGGSFSAASLSASAISGVNISASNVFACGGVNGYGGSGGTVVSVGNVGGGSVLLTFRGGILTNVGFA